MKRSLFMVLIALSTLIVAGPAIAQTDPYNTQTQPPAATTSTMTSGRILSKSDSDLSIKSDTGVQLTFTVDGSSNLPTPLNAGDRVDVEYRTDAGGQLHAVKVTNLSNDVPAGATPASGSTSPSGAMKDSGVADPQSGQAGNPPATKEMPRTASPLPVIALIGLLSIGAALTLRVASR